MPAVILDVDGTLIDSNDAHARAWLDAFAAHGITVPYETSLMFRMKKARQDHATA